MLVKVDERETISRVWMLELGWDQARCDQEFESEHWRNLFEWGEQIWFREGDEHPCINMFSGAFGVPAGWVDICCSFAELKRHTAFADEPS